MFNQQNWNNASSYGMPPYNSQLVSNIVYVTGPEEAVMRATQRNSDGVYFDQNKPVFYRVKVDFDGRKTWAAFPYNVDNVDNNATGPVSREEFAALVNEVKELKSKLTTEANTNEQSNG